VDQLESLTDNARTAASRAYFVYPPVADPSGATAYTVVRQIEDLEHGDSRIDEDRSEALRTEFASTRERLGDRYWEAEVGRGFAMDYYAQALLFDHESAKARERAGVLPGELANLRKLAEEGGFSPHELQAARTLAVLAEDDEAERQAQLTTLLDEDSGLSPGNEARLRALAEGDASPRGKRSSRRNRSTKPPPKTAEPRIAPAPAAVEPPEPAPIAAVSNPVSSPPTRDRSAAKALATQGHQALSRGRTKDAERLFHQALSADSRNAQARIGLSDIAFDRGKYKDAITHGRQAVNARPKNGAYRIRLGDAYFKLFRYNKAKEEYGAAAKLGHADAAGRIKKVDAKLGK
jgi:tetratricopeptide (TPR) repeat protein